MENVLIILQIFYWISIVFALFNLIRLNKITYQLNKEQNRLIKDVQGESLKMVEKIQELRFEKIILKQKVEKMEQIATSNSYENDKVKFNKIKEVIQSANKITSN